MRKKSIRSGMRQVLLAMILIILASFYLADVSEVLSLSYNTDVRFYRLIIFLAAAIGGYGVIQSVFGFVLPARTCDSGVRIMPSFLLIVGAVSLFFYLLVASLDAPHDPARDRLRPGEVITI
jgi:hypothetical protein